MTKWFDEVTARRGLSVALTVTDSDPDRICERVLGRGHVRVRVTKTSRTVTPELRLELTSRWGLIRWHGGDSRSISIPLEIDSRLRPPHGEELTLPFTVVDNGIETIQVDLYADTQCLTLQPAIATATVLRDDSEPPDSAPDGNARGSNLFICYAREDKKWMKLFRRHLKPASTLGLVTWSDESIGPGESWRARIHAALESSSSALLLVSADFLASDFILQVELPYLLAAAKSKNTTLLPVLISSCLHLPTPLADVQWIGDPARPLDLLPPAERKREVTRICELVAEFAKRGPGERE
jgi:hypothetical protein